MLEPRGEDVLHAQHGLEQALIKAAEALGIPVQPVAST